MSITSEKKLLAALMERLCYENALSAARAYKRWGKPDYLDGAIWFKEQAEVWKKLKT